MDIETMEICLNCRHWLGDREDTLRVLKNAGGEWEGLLLNPHGSGGWMPRGECRVLVAESVAEGDDREVETPAGFSCAFFVPRIEIRDRVSRKEKR